MHPAIYFDHAATTPILPEALHAMQTVYQTQYANPSSLYALGAKSKELLKNARITIAETLTAEPEQIYFTSGGTMSNYIGITGHVKEAQTGHIMTDKIEHASVLGPIFQFAKSKAYEATVLSVDENGQIDEDHLRKAIRRDTVLISLMHVNNETGAIRDIKKLTARIKECNPKALVHIDAIQSYGKLPLSLSDIPADALSISAHKIHGPVGIGALYIRSLDNFGALIHAGMQESGVFPGTENLPGICGFAEAAKQTFAASPTVHSQARDIYRRIKNELPTLDCEVLLNSPQEEMLASPYLLNFSLPGMNQKFIIAELDRRGIMVSGRSACNCHNPTPSYVLTAMGRTEKEAFGAIRIGIGRDNTLEDADRLIDSLREILREKRATKFESYIV